MLSDVVITSSKDYVKRAVKILEKQQLQIRINLMSYIEGGPLKTVFADSISNSILMQ